MENYYIRLKDGAPFEHPIIESNFVQAFPDVDLQSLPDWVARFNRLPAPPLGAFEVHDGTTYELVDGMWTDVWHIRPLTDSEKAFLPPVYNADTYTADVLAAMDFSE